MADVKYAAAYIRVSTDDQTEFSPDAQRSAIMKYASDNGYVLEESYIFSDEGFSGRKAEKRPAFMRMISMAKSKDHPFDVILVHKFDRFARSREDSVVYKSLLRKECGVRVISITESIDDDKFSIIIESMLEAMAEYYSINLAEEVIKGMTEKAKRGGLQARSTFGYRVENHIYVVVPEEAAFVREIFRRFISGSGYFEIAKYLNDLGIRTLNGNSFENRTIEYMIRNPVYIGKLRWTPTGRARRRVYENPDTIISDGAHEPIIDKSTWEAAQKRVAEIKAQRAPYARPVNFFKDWLSGMVRCPECGKTLVVFTDSWRCNGYAHGTCKHTQTIKQVKLRAMILAMLKYDSSEASVIDFNIVRASASSAEAALQAQIEKTQNKLSRLREAYLNGVETLEAYSKAKKALDAQITEAEAELAKENTPLADSSKAMKDKIKEALSILEDPEATLEQKHNAFAGIVDTCTYSRANNKITIHYRFLSE